MVRTVYLATMASLCLVDMALTGVYVVISSHVDLIPAYLTQNLLVLGAVNVVGALIIYRPIQGLLDAGAGAGERLKEKARARLESLPRLSMAWVFT